MKLTFKTWLIVENIFLRVWSNRNENFLFYSHIQLEKYGTFYQLIYWGAFGGFGLCGNNNLVSIAKVWSEFNYGSGYTMDTSHSPIVISSALAVVLENSTQWIQHSHSVSWSTIQSQSHFCPGNLAIVVADKDIGEIEFCYHQMRHSLLSTLLFVSMSVFQKPITNQMRNIYSDIMLMVLCQFGFLKIMKGVFVLQQCLLNG